MHGNDDSGNESNDDRLVQQLMAKGCSRKSAQTIARRVREQTHEQRKTVEEFVAEALKKFHE